MERLDETDERILAELAERCAGHLRRDRAAGEPVGTSRSSAAR